MTGLRRPCSTKNVQRESFHSSGADSVLSVELAFALGETPGLEIDPTMIYDSRTIRGFTDSVPALYAQTPGALKRSAHHLENRHVRTLHGNSHRHFVAIQRAGLSERRIPHAAGS
ncbi:acyl carrier protein [Burkholderia cepacia]|uniref:acyl carrier protein n=1 Tax=Burkholderia cepacia TaxID=292 RepID=UPI003D7DE062